jgi:uncharacterized membrane protein YbhN (UPF0104 family)
VLNKKTVRYVLSALVVFALVALVWNRRDDLAPLWEDPSWDLALIAVLIIVGHFLNSAEFWVVYRSIGVKVSFWENWMVFCSGLLGNLLPAQVGTIYKFQYMKSIHDLSYARNGSTYGANLIISLGSSAIVGIVGVIAYAVAGGDFAWIMLAAFVGIGVMCVVFLAIPLPTSEEPSGRIRQAISNFARGWNDIRSNPTTSITVTVIDVVKYIVTAWRFQLAFALLGVHESLWFFLVIAPAAAIAGIIAFTPGGIGIREFFITAAALGMGSSFDTGLLAATTDRGIMLVSAVVLGSLGYAYTVPRLRRATTQPTPIDVRENGA